MSGQPKHHADPCHDRQRLDGVPGPGDDHDARRDPSEAERQPCPGGCRSQPSERDRFLDSRRGSSYSARVPEISVATTPDGHAYIRLGDGEVRDSVFLGEHDEADRIPTLDSLVLHFDFYGRLTAIEVTGSVTSVLPPGLIDD